MSKIVGRTLDFLELFAEEKRPLALSDISRLLKVPVSSVHDVLRALQDRGYIYELAPRSGYYPTVRLLDLAKAISHHDPVIQRAELVLRALRDVVDESVLLSKVSGPSSTYLLSFEPSHPLRFTVNVGDRVRSLYATSAGKVQLSVWSPAKLEEFLRTAKLEPFTAKTIVSKPTLVKEIEAGRERGWFLNDEESQEGVVTLSTPFDWNGATYIITIAGPKPRLESQVEWAAKHLLEAKGKLEMRH